MLITRLEAEVLEENTGKLVAKYQELCTKLEPGIIESFLIQDKKNPRLWQILTVWESMEVIEHMRSQGTPAGILVFRAANTEPTLSLFEVKASATS